MINVTHNSDADREHIISDILPDLTPLLDVMFMLIIFLVLTTNSVPHVFDIILPEDNQEVSKSEEDPQAIVVSLSSEKDIWQLGEKTYQHFDDFSQALLILHRTSPNHNVMVYGDKSVPMGELLNLLTFMRAHDIPTADIVMQQK